MQELGLQAILDKILICELALNLIGRWIWIGTLDVLKWLIMVHIPCKWLHYCKVSRSCIAITHTHMWRSMFGISWRRMVRKWFFILPTVQTSHSLIFSHFLKVRETSRAANLNLHSFVGCRTCFQKFGTKQILALIWWKTNVWVKYLPLNGEYLEVAVVNTE